MADDFEELKRQFRRQFGEGSKTSVRRILGISLAALIVVLVLGLGLSSYYTVDADEVGVVLRLGRYHETADSGLHFKLPFGIDKVHLVKVDRINQEEFGFRTMRAGVQTEYSRGDHSKESLMVTADLGISDVDWVVQYRIQEPRKYLFKIKDVIKTLREVSESAVCQEVGDATIDEVITLRRRTIAVESQRHMQEILDEYDSGIEVVTVELKDVNPPEAVKDSFNEVNRAIQEKQTSINEARREWNKEIPGALGQAEQMVEAAEGYKTRRVNEARGDVARFQALRDQYARAKHVTRTRLYLETIEEVLPQVSQIFVVDGAGGGPLQLLDLKAAGARRVERAAEDEPAAVEPPSSRSSGGRR